MTDFNIVILRLILHSMMIVARKPPPHTNTSQNMFLCGSSRLPKVRIHLQAVQLLAYDEPQPIHASVVDCARPLVVLAEQSAPVQLLAQLLQVAVLPEDLVLVSREEPLPLVLEAPAPLL